MNVDSYSDLQEFEFPIGIGPQANNFGIPSIIFSTIS